MNLVVQIKTELGQLGIKPKKGLGQNFLVNEGVYKKIVDALEIKKSDTIVEVGPGLGTLTEFLAATGAEIIAIEKDNHLAEYLKDEFRSQKNVMIINEDILKFNPHNTKYLILNTKYKLVGNIPYYLTSHLLRIIFENWPIPELIVLMLQKEVAQRIVAKPPKMSLLAVSVQYYAAPKIISYVSKGSFWPSPEVDSAILKLVSSDQFSVVSGKIKTGNWKLKTVNFFKIARAGFAGKRKQLGNTLSGGLKIAKNIVEEKLKSIGVDPMRRAETLTIEEWQKVTNIFLPRD